MEYVIENEKQKVKHVKIAYIGGGSRGWAWGLMSDLVTFDDISGTVSLYDIDKVFSKKIKKGLKKPKKCKKKAHLSFRQMCFLMW